MPLSFLVASCVGQGGKLAADGTGNLLDEPVEHAHHAAALMQACGDGELTALGAELLTREPYLQQVDSTSAEVLFAAGGTERAMVDFTTPDGRVVASMSAHEESSAGLSRASLEGLTPDTVYCYAVRGLTEPTGFVTTALPGREGALRFIAFGDSGDGSHKQHQVMAQMEEVPFDLILHTGDVAYSDGTASQLQRSFFDVYTPILKNHAIYPVAGNHDYRSQNAEPLLEAFSLPDNGVSGASERYYAFDRGDVHFVALDTENLSDEQVLWLEADLAANQQTWTVAYGHHPAFSSGTHGSSRKVQQKLVPLFERYGVDLVLAGHDHHYERTHPINGVTYVVTGGGGRGTRAPVAQQFTAFAEGVLHFVYVHVQGNSLRLHAIDGVGREFDAIELERECRPSRCPEG